MLLLTPPRSAGSVRNKLKSQRQASKLLRSNDAYDTRRLQRLLLKRMARDEAAAEAAKAAPGSPAPEYRLVADGASAYGVRCKFSSTEAASFSTGAGNL